MTRRTAVPAEFLSDDPMGNSPEQGPAVAPPVHDHGGATDPQLKFIADLATERIAKDSPAFDKFWHRYGELAGAGELTKAKASEIISWLKERPKVAAAAPATSGRFAVKYDDMELDGGETRRVGSIIVPGAEHAVPAGRYALDVTGDDRFANDTIFIRVWVGDRGGFNAQLQNSDNDLVKPAFKVQLDLLRLIAEDPAAASTRYGREFGHCGVCGRGLTNDASRAAGIGPVCARRMAW